jgi:Transposase DDE domain group 1
MYQDMFEVRKRAALAMTECNQERFEFASASGSRTVVAEFNGGVISSDGGALLLGETDRKMNLLGRLGKCFADQRNQDRVEHSVEEMLRQRVFGLALGYEDLNDHEELRKDPVLGVLAGKQEPGKDLLAGKSTLNRMELGNGMPSRYKKITFWRDSVDDLLVEVFLESYAKVPKRIVLDIDTTDMALHGKQEERFFHGYYGHHCYLPLFIFCGDHVLCARLRPSNIGPAVGSRKEIERVVRQIRGRWPEVRIVLRGDSGFCTDELMSWCKANRVDFVIGMARNKRVERLTADALEQARQEFETTQKPARVFVELQYETLSGSWSEQRRVVAKAEHIEGKSNPRFIVTSLSPAEWEGKALYEDLYCGRGDMENRIKEQFVLFADRVSSSSMRANQLRVYLSVFAYTLMNGFRRLGLQTTSLATAQVGTIRLRLLKIGALVQVSVRKVWVRLANASPCKAIFAQALCQLRS